MRASISTQPLRVLRAVCEGRRVAHNGTVRACVAECRRQGVEIPSYALIWTIHGNTPHVARDLHANTGLGIPTLHMDDLVSWGHVAPLVTIMSFTEVAFDGSLHPDDFPRVVTDHRSATIYRFLLYNVLHYTRREDDAPHYLHSLIKAAPHLSEAQVLACLEVVEPAVRDIIDIGDKPNHFYPIVLSKYGIAMSNDITVLESLRCGRYDVVNRLTRGALSVNMRAKAFARHIYENPDRLEQIVTELPNAPIDALFAAVVKSDLRGHVLRPICEEFIRLGAVLPISAYSAFSEMRPPLLRKILPLFTYRMSDAHPVNDVLRTLMKRLPCPRMAEVIAYANIFHDWEHSHIRTWSIAATSDPEDRYWHAIRQAAAAARDLHKTPLAHDVIYQITLYLMMPYRLKK